jgi:lysophospholipase L1-like esterase
MNGFGIMTLRKSRIVLRMVQAVVLVAVVTVGYVGVNVGVALWRAHGTPDYWRARADEPVQPGALRLVAFGDSATEAIGASQPQDGFVGRIADYVQQRTGRPVHVVNTSQGGATAGDVVRNQLPTVDPRRADLVIVETSNDMEQRKPVAEYRQNLTRLLDALPPGRTVVSDLPLEDGRAPYQQVLQEVADHAGIRRADFAKVFTQQVRDNDIFSWLPPHLNSRGYWYWFTAFQPRVDEVLASRGR